MYDTDADWSALAEQEPYYGVFTNPAMYRANLTPETLAEFWASGRADIAGHMEMLRSHFGGFEPRTAIDFGCGVGRLVRAMAEIVDHVYGVDVAPSMLEEARIGAPPNASFIEKIPDAKVDWINSLIVFQHIPPARGIELLRELLDRLDHFGGISLHFTIFKSIGALNMQRAGVELFQWNGNDFRALASTPAKGGMQMFDYDLTQILAVLIQAGIGEVAMRHTDHGGHHGVLIVGRKG